jgi:chromatin remodeling complex protein RSC6
MSKFHCILKARLPTFPNGRETITVWKRSKVCPFEFPADSDDEEDDGAEEGAEEEDGEEEQDDDDDDDDDDEEEEEEREEDENEEEAEDDEEEEDAGEDADAGVSVQWWRYIPEDERLPTDSAAKCVAHLL